MAGTTQLDMYMYEVQRLRAVVQEQEDTIQSQQRQIKAQQDHIYDLRLAAEKT